MKSIIALSVLFVAQSVFAHHEYLCTIKTSRTSVAQTVVEAFMLTGDPAGIPDHRIENLSAGNTFKASIVKSERTQEEALEVDIDYVVNGVGYNYTERLVRRSYGTIKNKSNMLVGQLRINLNAGADTYARIIKFNCVKN